jgi:hypothetical protein
LVSNNLKFLNMLHDLQEIFTKQSYNYSYSVVKVKGNVPVLFLTEHHAMKAYWGSGGTAPLIL